jgi:hypothetical protein
MKTLLQELFPHALVSVLVVALALVLFMPVAQAVMHSLESINLTLAQAAR